MRRLPFSFHINNKTDPLCPLSAIKPVHNFPTKETIHDLMIKRRQYRNRTFVGGTLWDLYSL
jgi:hypothetical protein